MKNKKNVPAIRFKGFAEEWEVINYRKHCRQILWRWNAKNNGRKILEW